MKSLLTLTLIFLTRLAFAAAADGPQDIAFKSTADGSEQRYVELLPPGFNEDEAHDVVLAFHGHGSDRWQFIKDPRGECAGMRDVAARFRAILVSPDYRAKTSWMGPAAEADTLQIIAELKQRHKIDRVFLAGGSMGGTAVLTFTVLHPELVAGVCSLNGTANLVGLREVPGRAHRLLRRNESRSAGGIPQAQRGVLSGEVHDAGGLHDRRQGRRGAAAKRAAPRGETEESGPSTRCSAFIARTGGHSTNYDDTCAAMEFIFTSTGAMPLRPAGISATEQRAIAQELASIEQRIWLRR